MLNRIYRGTPAVASCGFPEARAALTGGTVQLDAPEIGTKPISYESQAFHRKITDIVRPGLDWPSDLNRQPAVACSGTTPSTLLYTLFIR